MVKSTACELLVHLMRMESNALQQEHLVLIQTVLLTPERMTQFAVDAVTAAGGHVILRVLSQASQNRNQTEALFAPHVVQALETMLRHPKLHENCADTILAMVHTLVFATELMDLGRELLKPMLRTLIDHLKYRLMNLTKNYSKTSQRALSAPEVTRIFRLLTFLADPDCDMIDGALPEEDASSLLEGLCFFLTKATAPSSRNTIGGWKKRKHTGNDGIVVNNDETAAKLKHQLMTRDEAEAELMRLAICLVKCTSNIEGHVRQWARLLSIVESRVCRALLCQLLDEGAARLPSTRFEELVRERFVDNTKARNPFPADSDAALAHDAVYRLMKGESSCKTLLGRALEAANAYDPRRIDQPDVVVQERALTNLTCLTRLFHTSEQCEPRLAEMLHLVAIQQALYSMDKGNLQVRDAALDYLIDIAKVCNAHFKETGSDTLIKRLVLAALWPGILRAIREFSGTFLR
ncbi:hypothetical protein Ciccas_011658 [Cichlidogyrus casuarinus]|uniref:U3 small nucleolar RNA-associated protein 20 N-terminal domain-containing protein n=1 Tax=Cichlidogyrus casuarinus TaxID=1844966 RepID=A0ABD2PRH8_9PLAT